MKIAANRIATELVIKTSRAAMPSSCWGDYARVAVLRVTVGAVPKAIDDRRRNVLEIVETWEKCNVWRQTRARLIHCVATGCDQ
jgi:hypothetical protein